MKPMQCCAWRRAVGAKSAAICAALALAMLPAELRALTPKSPEVKASIAKAVEYLATHNDGGVGIGQGRPGAKALVALVMVKADLLDHPRVQEGLNAVKNDVLPNGAADIYTLGLSLILLTELPPDRRQQYDPEVLALLDRLKQLQKPGGGWGYPNMQTGDTSMTQYAALGMWSAEGAGFETPPEAWEKLTNWLMRTQAADGAFGYQGKDPGDFNPVAQERVTLSMCTAGAGSLYVCADHFTMFDPESEVDDGTPSQMKRIKKKRPNESRAMGTVDPARLKGAIGKSDQLLANFQPEPKDPSHAYPFYYIYAAERYRSFRDLAEGRMAKANYEPEWYTAGARHLMSKQAADGSWGADQFEVGVVPNTSFATLFLLRSMKKSIERIKHLGDGTLVGGKGLPDNMEDAKLRLGGVKAKKISGPARDLLNIIGDPNDEKFEQALVSIEEDGLEAGDEQIGEVAKRLRELAKGQSPQARAAALTALGRTRDLDQAPLLIEALKDPEPLVFSAANDALRFMSRKFYGAGFWGGSDEKTRQDSIAQWKAWYLSIRPGAILE